MPQVLRWASPPHNELLWETFGQANFIYHAASGQTHYLNELGAWILRYISLTPSSSDEIRNALLEAFAAEDSSELTESVDATVRMLAGLGLVVDAASQA